MSAHDAAALAILKQEGKSDVELVTEYAKTYTDDELLEDLGFLEHPSLRSAPDGYYDLWHPALHTEAIIRGLIRE